MGSVGTDSLGTLFMLVYQERSTDRHYLGSNLSDEKLEACGLKVAPCKSTDLFLSAVRSQ